MKFRDLARNLVFALAIVPPSPCFAQDGDGNGSRLPAEDMVIAHDSVTASTSALDVGSQNGDGGLEFLSGQEAQDEEPGPPRNLRGNAVGFVEEAMVKDENGQHGRALATSSNGIDQTPIFHVQSRQNTGHCLDWYVGDDYVYW